MAAGATLRPHERIVAGADYRRVFQRGVRLDGPFFLLVAAESGRAHHRLGLAASRKLGGAVARNRAKRLVREAFRRIKSAGLPAHDLVFVPKHEILDASWEGIEREYRERLRRLQRRARRAGAAPPSSD